MATLQAGLRRHLVFLSFRGADTREGFTSHLYKALCDKHIDVYIDFEHEKAEKIATILEKIETAVMSIIVFSERFADSEFCLDEVVKMVECNEKYGHKILPVFYRVSTDDVQEKNINKGKFAKAIAALEESAKKRGDMEMLAKVSNWREAMTFAASDTGLVSTNYRDDAEFVDEIVKQVSLKLCDMSPNVESKNLVGMESRIQRIKNSLKIGSDDTKIITIWGMGGSGKTTLAEEAFKIFSPSFQNRYFLESVTETYKKTSLNSLKLELYSGLRIDNLKSAMDLENAETRARLKNAKNFIVLDDVDERSTLLKLLLGGTETFGSGSKIIVTSRNEVFEKTKEELFRIGELDDAESIQLFSRHAFEKDDPPENRLVQSKSVINYCRNNPLALKVLGSTLHSITNDSIWESVLKGLGKKVFPEIHDVLKVSYNRLSKDQQKLFLDIACFLRGEDIDYAMKILESCYDSAYAETTFLIKKALVIMSVSRPKLHISLLNKGTPDMARGLEQIYNLTMGKDTDLTELHYTMLRNEKVMELKGFYDSEYAKASLCVKQALKFVPYKKLEMHDLIQEMSRDIVKEQSGVRLWEPRDVRYVLEGNEEGLNVIEGMFLDLSKTTEIKIDPVVFTNMKNIRLLNFFVPNGTGFMTEYDDKLTNDRDLESLGTLKDLASTVLAIKCKYVSVFGVFGPGSISVSMDCKEKLSFGGDLESFPSKLHYMHWHGFPLTSFPPRFSATKLVELNLPYSKITQLWRTVQTLPKLKQIDLSHSKNLTEIPDLSMAESVERINLEGCESLKELHSSIKNLQQLEYLNLSGCSNLNSLPGKLMSKELKILDLSHCPNIRICPEVFGQLLVLNLSWTAIKDLPKSFSNLKIVILDLTGCKNISASITHSVDRVPSDRSKFYRNLLEWKYYE